MSTQRTLNTRTSFSEAVHFETPSLEQLSAQERIAWADHNYGSRLMLSTSFGTQSAVLLHMVKDIVPDVKIVFADTQHLHPETYDYMRQLIDRLELGPNLHVYKARESRAEQEAKYGRPWEEGPWADIKNSPAMDAYRIRNKVEPVNRAVEELGIVAWLSGRRRQQSARRSQMEVLEQQREIVKINPLADWISRDVYRYMKHYNLPLHPLWEKGSVGDFFEPERVECGLHDLSIVRPEGAGFHI